MSEEDKQAFRKWREEFSKPWWSRTEAERKEWEYMIWCAGRQYQHEKEST